MCLAYRATGWDSGLFLLYCFYMSVAWGFVLERTGYILYVSDTCVLMFVCYQLHSMYILVLCTTTIDRSVLCWITGGRFGLLK